MPFPTLKVQKLGEFYWITGDPVEGPYGPYSTQQEAEEDRVGVTRSMRNVDISFGENGCWTTDHRARDREWREQMRSNSGRNWIP